MVVVVGVSKARTSGSVFTKKGKVAYRGKKRHWYVYFYDDDGRFRKRQISAVEVPYYGSLIRRRKTYQCPKCGHKFRAWDPRCPKCKTKSVRLKRGSESAPTPKGPAPKQHAASAVLDRLLDLERRD